MTDVSVNHFQNSHSRLQFDLCNFLVCKVSECRPIFVIYSYNHKGYWLEKEGPIAILEKKLSWEILKNPQENTSVWVFFFFKKRDSNTGVFLWILLSFSKYLFLKNLIVTASEEILTPYSVVQKCFKE